MTHDNPLLQAHQLPRYSSVRVEHIQPAIDQIIVENLQAIAAIVASQSHAPTWEGLVLPIEDLNGRLDEVTHVITTLEQVPKDEIWRTTVHQCVENVDAYKSLVLQNRGLFLACKTLSTSTAAASFDDAKRGLLAEVLLRFRLAGVELQDEERDRLNILNRQIAALEWTFYVNTQVASKAWKKHIIDESQLAGLPAELKALLARKAQAAQLSGWLITLEEQAIYTAIMRVCENRPLREELFTANNTRASDQGPLAGQNDNGPVLAELLLLRHQKALLLGYDNHAQLALQNKMATSTDQVLSFLRTRITQQTPYFTAQTAALHELATTLQYPSVQPWDLLFLAQKMGLQKSPLSNDQLKPYFAFKRVFTGMALIIQRLFGIELVEQTSFDAWHPDVRLFAVLDSGVVLGHLFIDPYLRDPKGNGCWMQSARNRRINAQGELITPVAIFHGNFTPEAEGSPSLLSHVQLSMLFHEMGHCLKHLLTRSPYKTLSGVDSLAPDTAEFSGASAEEWCWSRDSLRWLAKHVHSDSELTYEQIDQVLAARKAEFWLANAQELMRAMFDFEVHRTYGDGRSVQAVWLNAQQAVLALPTPANDRFANTFDYIVTGYDAGYYAYQWSESLAHQMFARFVRDGVFNPETGQAFREAFYAPGAERSLFESFEAFIGHAPTGE